MLWKAHILLKCLLLWVIGKNNYLSFVWYNLERSYKPFALLMKELARWDICPPWTFNFYAKNKDITKFAPSGKICGSPIYVWGEA